MAIERFEDLRVWQVAQDYAVLIYRLTKLFPEDERFGITIQMRRCTYSISANIAEGFGRRTKKDKSHFYTMAYGSLLETRNFLYLCERLGYAKQHVIKPLLDDGVALQKQINALISCLT